MINSNFLVELAELLDVDSDVAGRLLSDFYSAMVTDFLAVGTLSVKGLGTFTVKHIPVKKKSTASSIIYTPPVNILSFEWRVSRPDDVVRIALSYLFMTQVEARRFGRILGKVFSRAVKQRKEIYINGFGKFSLESGSYRFIPESSLELLLNREYQDLNEVVLTQHRARNGTVKTFRYVVIFSVMLLLSVFAASFYYSPQDVWFYFFKAPKVHGSVVSSETRVTQVDRLDSVQDTAAMLSKHEKAADSVVLVTDGYTIVLVTFSNLATVHKEVLRLRTEGIPVFVWPGYEKKIKYYRLITGSFLNRRAAVERLKRMPEKIGGRAYIQHVIKRVVLHGEKGL